MQIHVVVSYDDSLFGRIVRWYGLQWSHAALRYVRQESIGPRVIEAGSLGIKERSWDDFVAGSEEYRVLQIRGSLPETIKREIVAYAWGNVGKPYNYGWLLKLAWELLKRRLVLGVLTYPAHICSSLVHDSFLYGRINLVPGHAGVLVTPDDLANSPLLEQTLVP